MIEGLGDHLHWQADHCRALGSDFYGTLLDGLADDVRVRGPIAQVLGGFEGSQRDSALALRLLGGVHRMVLAGDAPALGVHYPSVGGDGDALAVVGDVVSLVERYAGQIRSGLSQAPQTNEVGRSAALFGALLHLKPKVPVRIFELGASAGLNLLGDHYRYLASDGSSWGPGSSPVVLDQAWNRVPAQSRVDVSERIGIDLAPVDVTTDDGALTLASYVWPDQTARLARLRSAIDIARHVRPEVGTGRAIDLLRTIELEPGNLTVVWHSVMSMYLGAEEREETNAELRRLIEGSDGKAPFAHISFEPDPSHSGEPDGDQYRAFGVSCEDRNGVRHLGVGPPHGLPIRWG